MHAQKTTFSDTESDFDLDSSDEEERKERLEAAEEDRKDDKMYLELKKVMSRQELKKFELENQKVLEFDTHVKAEYDLFQSEVPP